MTTPTLKKATKSFPPIDVPSGKILISIKIHLDHPLTVNSIHVPVLVHNINFDRQGFKKYQIKAQSKRHTNAKNIVLNS